MPELWLCRRWIFFVFFCMKLSLNCLGLYSWTHNAAPEFVHIYQCCIEIETTNIRKTFLIELPPLRTPPQNSPSEQPHILLGLALHKVSKVFHRPMLTPMLPTVLSSWLDVLWVEDHFLIHTGNRWVWKPRSVAVLETLKPVRLTPTTIPRSKAQKYFVLPIHPLNGTHTQSMS